MKSRQSLSQLPRLLPLRHQLLWAALVAAGLVLGAGSAEGQSEVEEIYVLSAGGVGELKRFSIRHNSQSATTIDKDSPLLLTTFDGGLAAFSDLTVLPNGRIMLASSLGGGAMVFDDQGLQIDDIAANGAPLTSAVAAGFVTPDEPDLVLLSQDTPGRIRLHDVIDDLDDWTLPFGRDGEEASIIRSIRLVDDQIATAALWPTLDLSAVEIASVDDPADVERIIWSRHHPERLEEEPVIDDLHPLRDLVATVDGDLLITAAHQISLIAPDGQLLWSMNIGDDPALGGEFESARWLDTDLIALATRQPGLWTQPHSNHRIHLVDPDADVPLVASSAPLSSAPLAVESARGIAATGTGHYFADAFDDEGLQASKLSLTSGPTLDPPDPRRDDSTRLSLSVANEADETITLRRLEFRSRRASCSDDDNDFATTWWSDDAITTLEPGDTWELDEEILSTAAMAVDDHCGRITAVGRDGTPHLLGDIVEFEIRSPDGHDQVIVDEIAEHGDAGPAGDSGLSGGETSSGCTCSSAPGRAAIPSLLVLAALFGLRLRRTRQHHR